MVLYSLFIFTFLLSVTNFRSTTADKVLGCNGFIRSDVTIDYSKVEVKLISKEGNLKDRIECAPNNGYFFLPIYDKGEYTLEISSIYKWSFEPKQIKLNFDGVTDACSSGKDIIFQFKGFRVFGKVGSVDDKKSPKGITVSLVADLPTEQKEIYSVLTEENGSFDISPVMPGSYIMKASHPRWRISKSLVTFVVEKGNYELPAKSLLFSGFVVSGSVVSNTEPIAGVQFILFANPDSKVDPNWFSGCDKSPVKGFDCSDLKLSASRQICSVTSTEKGAFVFPSVPSGSYILVPFYKGLNSLKFDVHPRMVRFTVQQDCYAFAKPFQVSGFSVMGRIVTSSTNGKPLSGMKVILGKEKIAQTNDDGVYIFEGVKSGSYSLQVEGDDYQFSNSEVKIAPNAASLNDIHPVAFKICGKIQKLQNVPVTVVFRADDEVSLEAEANELGEYCLHLSSGNFTANAVPTGMPKEKLLWFSPLNYPVKVVDRPLKNINFQQKTAELVGRVECVDDNVCGGINIVLRGLEPLKEEYKSATKEGKFKFTGLYPGSYDLSIADGSKWCWESDNQRIEITEITNKVAPFQRTGLSFPVFSSHNTKLKYKKLSSNETVLKEGVLDIKEGDHRYCLPGGSIFVLEPVGCHRYMESVLRWEVGQESLKLKAVSHEMTAFILSPEIVNDLNVSVYTDHNATLKATIGPLKPTVDKRRASDHVYKFQFQAAANEKLTLIPESSSLLFSPQSLTVRGADDCTELEQHILAKRGIRLQGHVEPALENVKISILNELDEILISMFTDAEGKYKFMPLQSDHRYRVIGEKEGYLLSGPFEDGLFKAHKLAEVQVKLIDSENKPLQGVLLSLSGGENYRQTSQSNADGVITFLSLKPSEYYLRPVLKEYKFLPPSKVINIKEGETVPVEFKGRRVLYSVFGTVFSLNRIPEKDIVIEAVSRAEGECVQHQEEGTSDEKGQFRIRGLQPECNYDIRLKEAPAVNKQIRKTLPANVNIKMNASDVRGIELIALLEPTECDLVVYVSVDSAEHLRTLSIKLVDDDETVIHSIKLSDWKLSRYPLNSILLPFPALPLNGRNYHLQLDSSLSKSAFDFGPQMVSFTANSTYQLVKFAFKPELKFSDGEIKHSYTAAVFFMVAALLYWCRESVLLALAQLQSNSRLTVPDLWSRYSQPAKAKENEKTFIEFEPGLTVVERKWKGKKK